MPGGNGNGPAGAGLKTGRGMGICAGFEQPGYTNSAFGRGCGMGLSRGSRNGCGPVRGRGYGRISPAETNAASKFSNTTENTELELKQLRQQGEVLQNNLTMVKNRIDELTKQ